MVWRVFLGFGFCLASGFDEFISKCESMSLALLTMLGGSPASFATCIPYDLSAVPGRIFLRKMMSSFHSLTATL